MGILTQSLKFNLRTGGFHHLPQTIGDGTHILPNPVIQLFICARFLSGTPPSLPSRKGKSHRARRSVLLAGHCWGPRCPSHRPANFTSNLERTLSAKCWRCAIVHENKFIDVFPARYAGCGWTYRVPPPSSPQIGMLIDGHLSVRP
jgi:hypothetical protein